MNNMTKLIIIIIGASILGGVLGWLGSLIGLS